MLFIDYSTMLRTFQSLFCGVLEGTSLRETILTRPRRELLPREGALGLKPRVCYFSDFSANEVKSFIHFTIGKTNYFQFETLQIRAALPLSSQSPRLLPVEGAVGLGPTEDGFAERRLSYSTTNRPSTLPSGWWWEARYSSRISCREVAATTPLPSANPARGRPKNSSKFL